MTCALHVPLREILGMAIVVLVACTGISPSPTKSDGSDCAEGRDPQHTGTLRVCPSSARIGSTVSIEGSRCNNAGAPAIVYFVGPTTGASQNGGGSVEVGRFRVDSEDHFTASFTIPRQLDPIQGAGGGLVGPGRYVFSSRPDALCVVSFTVLP